MSTTDDTDDVHECPSCGGEFESFKGVSIHHGKAHDNNDIREMLIKEVKMVAEEVGRTPKLKDLESHSNLSTGPFTNGKRFDGWNGALEAAGFAPNIHYNIGEEEAIAEIERAAEELGRTPTYDDLGSSVKYSDSVYTRIFGSWDAALEAAGFETWEPPTGEEHHRWGGGPVEIVCDREGCGEKRKVAPSRIDRSRFCSRECKDLWQMESGVFEREQNPFWKGGLTEIECDRERCDSTRKVVPARLDQARFCSRECADQWSRETDENVGENHHQYAGGGPWSYGPNWDEQSRKARERDGYECQYCGLAAEDHPRELPVHHIKPIRHFREKYNPPEWYEKANRLKNLVTLCDSCHPKWEGIPLRPDTRQTAD